MSRSQSTQEARRDGNGGRVDCPKGSGGRSDGGQGSEQPARSAA